MADPFGFLKHARVENPTRPVSERITDWEELQTPLPEEERQEQAARCMNCGIPFCHTGSFFGGQRTVSGCPNDNLIPEWNDLVYQGRTQAAFERLARTNPLPEMTDRIQSRHRRERPCRLVRSVAIESIGASSHSV